MQMVESSMQGKDQGVVRMQEHDHTLSLQIEGRATMRHSPAVRQAAEQRMSSGPLNLYLDLSRCTYMDSTFLGTLLNLKRALEAGGGAFLLVDPSAQCLRVLRQMGLRDMFMIAPPGRHEPREWQELGTAPAELERVQRGLVEAHQELAGLPGPTGEAFRTLATRLMEEWETGKEPGGRDHASAGEAQR